MKNSRDPGLLCAEARSAWDGLRAAMAALGEPIRLTSTYRDQQWQQALFAKGRDSDGRIIDPSKIVTYTLASMHSISDHGHPSARAFDWCFERDIDEDGKLTFEEMFGSGRPWAVGIAIGVAMIGMRTIAFWDRDANRFHGDLGHLQCSS